MHVEKCDESVCINGECTVLLDGARCNCAVGWTGPSCEGLFSLTSKTFNRNISIYTDQNLEHFEGPV